MEKNMEKNNNAFSFSIIKTYAQLGERKGTGFCREINFVSFHGAAPKWDIRDWNEDHTKMSRGIQLSDQELVDLGAAIDFITKDVNENGKPCIVTSKRPEGTASAMEIFDKANAVNEAVMAKALAETRAAAEKEASERFSDLDGRNNDASDISDYDEIPFDGAGMSGNYQGQISA